MGCITAITPQIDHTSVIKRISVSAEDIVKVGRIRIHQFNPEHDGLATLKYEKLKGVDGMLGDMLIAIYLLWKVSFCANPRRPGWSGMMQARQASTMFLPMIDINPSDMNCVYSVLIVVSDHAHRYGLTPIITINQPLWWKAMTIV